MTSLARCAGWSGPDASGALDAAAADITEGMKGRQHTEHGLAVVPASTVVLVVGHRKQYDLSTIMCLTVNESHSVSRGKVLAEHILPYTTTGQDVGHLYQAQSVMSHTVTGGP